jgi:hypothetical protein
MYRESFLGPAPFTLRAAANKWSRCKLPKKFSRSLCRSGALGYLLICGNVRVIRCVSKTTADD